MTRFAPTRAESRNAAAARFGNRLWGQLAVPRSAIMGRRCRLDGMGVTPAFRGSQAIADGRVTRGQLRGTGYLPLFRDIYLPAGQRLDLEARSRASTLLLPPGGALAGHSAAVLWRAGCSPVEADVEIAVPGGAVRPRPGLWCTGARRPRTRSPPGPGSG